MSANAQVGAFPDDVVSARKKDLAFRKISIRLLPVLILSFVVSYIDRTNVGFAALTMNRDLGLTATEFGWGAGILFFGYYFFEVPSNVALLSAVLTWVLRLTMRHE